MSLISVHCEIMNYLELTCQYPRRGGIRSYSELSSEADEVANKLEQLESENK